MANAGIVGVYFVERKVVAFYWELRRFLEEFGNVVAFHNNLFFIQIPGQCMYCSHFQLQFLRPGSRYSLCMWRLWWIVNVVCCGWSENTESALSET